MPDTLRIIPLGGVGEVGKNITVIEAAGEILVVDCGLAFPEPEMLGIDLVIPDVSYLEANRDRVRAILLTHGHEDHTGGLPYVLPKIPGTPIFASRLTLGLVTGKLKQLIGEAAGRVIVATFASNIGRVQQVVDAAWAHGRKMVALGRSMEQNITIALELGYLDGRDGTLIKKDGLQRVPMEELVIMTTGSQGEPMSGLTRMSNRDHRNITIEPGDTVNVSASPIPGNEEAVAKTIANHV